MCTAFSVKDHGLTFEFTALLMLAKLTMSSPKFNLLLVYECFPTLLRTVFFDQLYRLKNSIYFPEA